MKSILQTDGEIYEAKKIALQAAQNNIPKNNNWDLLGEAQRIYDWLTNPPTTPPIQ